LNIFIVGTKEVYLTHVVPPIWL